MRVAFYPFCSQQDKRTGRFLLESDSGVKLCAYMAKQRPDSYLVLPMTIQCEDDRWRGDLPHTSILRVPYRLAQNNLHRRLQWEPDWLVQLASLVDCVFTTHLFLPFPLRCVAPKCKIVLECDMMPDTAWPQAEPLFKLAWASSDLAVSDSKRMALETSKHSKRSAHWFFAYEDSIAKPRKLERTIDVLFPSRCSATEYTNHTSFVHAMAGSERSIVIGDPTSYLRPHKWVLEKPFTRNEYLDVLHRSKVVVGLTQNFGSGYAFREAMAAGALPVTLDTPEYRELLTDRWPYFCTLGTIQATVERALAMGWLGVETWLLQEVMDNLKRTSYSEAWKIAKADFDSLDSI